MTDSRGREPAAPNALTRRANRTSFKKGEPGPRLTHGLYTDAHPQAEAILADVDRFDARQLADEGGDEREIAARRSALLRYRTRIVHKNILKIAVALEERGIVDRRGKLRVPWLQMLNAYLNTAIRLDALLGLERRAREVRSIEEWIDGLDTNDLEEDMNDADDDAPAKDEGAAQPSDRSETDEP